MEDEVRRSSRTNKGTHSGRAEHDVYYLPSGEEPALKKSKVASAEDSVDFQGAGGSAENEGEVRCDACGTTDANYDEETDEGGFMIECERCKTWQHARCMGYRTEKQIPKLYLCNRCGTQAQREHRDDGVWEIPSTLKDESVKQQVGPGSAASLKMPSKPQSGGGKSAAVVTKAAKEAKTRANVAKALVNVIVRTKSDVVDAEGWGTKLEAAVYSWAGATDKKYIEKSRSVMALLKRPAVLTRLITNDLNPADLIILPVEDIDPALKDYADKVRQESIRRSVLTVNDDSSQRIRRTHKGEEIVETKTDDQHEGLNVDMVARKVDHRKFQEELPSDSASKQSSEILSKISGQAPAAAPALYQLGDDDDDDFNHEASKANGEDDNRDGDAADSGTRDLDESASDDELAFILKTKESKKAPKQGKRLESEKPRRAVLSERAAAPALPPIMPSEFWAGEIVFPDVATFGVSAEFVSCTNYEKPKDVVTASFHNKAMRVCKELLEKRSYQVEGRLDRAKADPYLSQIVKSRDLYLVRLKKEDPNYSKVYEYLVNRARVGVLSGRAPMVKDAYLFALSHETPPYMDFATVGEGLYVLFSVKKDYTPAAKSILKKSAPVTQAPRAAVANLDSILSKLGGSVSGNQGPNLPQKPASFSMPMQSQQSANGTPAQLSQDQMSFLSSVVQQNPQVQSDPQALLNLLQSMQT